MKLIKGNIFKVDCDALCITTNGYIKKDRTLVMGAGVAKQAKQIWPLISYTLGQLVIHNGNKVQLITSVDKDNGNFDHHFRITIGEFKKLREGIKLLISFPVKHNWWEDADLELIDKSCKELKVIMDKYELKKVILPKPGCGNGRLRWKVVKLVLDRYFKTDNRLFIIDRE